MFIKPVFILNLTNSGSWITTKVSRVGDISFVGANAAKTGSTGILTGDNGSSAAIGTTVGGVTAGGSVF